MQTTMAKIGDSPTLITDVAHDSIRTESSELGMVVTATNSGDGSGGGPIFDSASGSVGENDGAKVTACLEVWAELDLESLSAECD